MAKYYVNSKAQTTGEHEVHKEGCDYLPAPEHRVYLGDFTNCKEAVKEARKRYSDVDGCYYCSKDCHTK